MNKGLLSMLGAAAFMAGSAGTGQAAGFTHGNICVAGPAGGNQTMIATHPFGPANRGSTALDMLCALPDSGSVNTKLSVFTFDRHESVNFRCELQGFDTNGAFALSSTFVPSGPGGPGTSVIKTTIDLPVGNAGRIWTLKCTVPPVFVKNGAQNFSHILGARLGT